MIRTAVRRVGLLTATTALAAAAFAGVASADPGSSYNDSDKYDNKVTGYGAPGGSNKDTSGGCGLAVGIGSVDVIGHVLTGGGIEKDPVTQCNNAAIAGEGGDGIEK